MKFICLIALVSVCFAANLNAVRSRVLQEDALSNQMPEFNPADIPQWDNMNENERQQCQDLYAEVVAAALSGGDVDSIMKKADELEAAVNERIAKEAKKRTLQVVRSAPVYETVSSFGTPAYATPYATSYATEYVNAPRAYAPEYVAAPRVHATEYVSAPAYTTSAPVYTTGSSWRGW